MKKYMILCCAALAGCSSISLGDLRQEPPSASKVFHHRDYETIGSCTAETIQTSERSDWSSTPANLIYETTHRRGSGRYALTGYMAHSMKILTIDILFIQTTADTVTVETRQGGIDGGSRRGGLIIEEQIWPMIDRCAA